MPASTFATCRLFYAHTNRKTSNAQEARLIRIDLPNEQRPRGKTHSYQGHNSFVKPKNAVIITAKILNLTLAYCSVRYNKLHIMQRA